MDESGAAGSSIFGVAVPPPPEPSTADRVRRGLGVATAVTLVSALVAAVLVTTRPGDPDRDLAAIVAFVGEAATVHVEVTDEWSTEGAREGLGSTFATKAKGTGDVRLPHDSRWVHDLGDFVSESITIGDTVYSRSADDPEALRGELWTEDRIAPADDGGAATSPVPIDGEGLSESESLLGLGLMLGGVGKFDLRQMVGHLEHPERVAHDVIRVRVPLAPFLRSTVDTTGWDPEVLQELDDTKGDVVIDLASGDKGRLDRMLIKVRAEMPFDDEVGIPAEVTTSTSDMRFTRWGAPVELTPPPVEQIDATPAIDEDDLASAPFAVLAPRTVPPPLKLVEASFFEGIEDAGECPSVTFRYADPEAEERSYEDENVIVRSLDLVLTSAACTADDEFEGEDRLVDEFPRDAKAAPFVAGPNRGTVYRYTDPDYGQVLHITMDVGGTRFSIDADIPEAQVVAALAELVPFDPATQPVATIAP